MHGYNKPFKKSVMRALDIAQRFQSREAVHLSSFAIWKRQDSTTEMSCIDYHTLLSLVRVIRPVPLVYTSAITSLHFWRSHLARIHSGEHISPFIACIAPSSTLHRVDCQVRLSCCAPAYVGVPEGEAPGRRVPEGPPSEGVEMGRYAKRGACVAAAMTLASPAGAPPRPSAGAADPDPYPSARARRAIGP